MKDLRIMKVDELKNIAREYGIVGAWKKTKNQLIENIIAAAELNGHVNEYFDSEAQNAPEQPQDEPESTEELETDSLSVNEEKSSELTVEPSEPIIETDGKSNLKSYGAWVVDRETKELTTIIRDAGSREEFYLSIKDQYRVRLITKPEKLEEECKQWEIRHARNKIKKNEKYAADKAEANKLGMNVHEYRKYLRESVKTDK